MNGKLSLMILIKTNMKILKLIEILKDKSNWSYKDGSSYSGIVHKPTGINCYGEYTFWNKEDKVIYETGIIAIMFIKPLVKKIKTKLNTKGLMSLDTIYDAWKAEQYANSIQGL